MKGRGQQIKGGHSWRQAARCCRNAPPSMTERPARTREFGRLCGSRRLGLLAAAAAILLRRRRRCRRLRLGLALGLLGLEHVHCGAGTMVGLAWWSPRGKAAGLVQRPLWSGHDRLATGWRLRCMPGLAQWGASAVPNTGNPDGPGARPPL